MNKRELLSNPSSRYIGSDFEDNLDFYELENRDENKFEFYKVDSNNNVSIMTDGDIRYYNL